MTGSDGDTVGRRFALVVHDVAPTFLSQLSRIVDSLAVEVGREMSAAVVPCWHGRPIDGSSEGFQRLVARAFGEILQHGYTHQQDRPGLLSLLTCRSDEFGGVPGREAMRRIVRGREILRSAMGVEVAGFVPPAWQTGSLTMRDLGASGFRYMTTFGAIRQVDGPTIPLSTWSWDWGILGGLGRVGHRLGEMLSRIRPTALPCVVVHPADVDRGYLPRVLEVVDALRDNGRTPAVISGFVS